MKAWWKRWWPVLKLLLAVAILAIVGVRFAQDLSQLDLHDLAVRPVWLVVSAGLYLVGLSFSACYWHWLLWKFGEKPGLLSSLRAYYVGMLGKYIPGKAIALVMRGSLAVSPDVKFGVAVITAFYEVLTTMASGALVAALLFSIWPPRIGGLEWNPVFMGLLLVGLMGVPLLPGVFNRLVGGLARRFQNVQSFKLPQLRTGTLLLGVAMTSAGWLFLGLSLWAMLQALLPEPPVLEGVSLARFTAMLSLSYVAGFLALVVPGGVGVREYVLLQLLPEEIPAVSLPAAEPVAAMIILMLRVLWTGAELVTAGVLYFWPGLGKSISVKEPALPHPPLAKGGPEGSQHSTISSANPEG